MTQPDTEIDLMRKILKKYDSEHSANDTPRPEHRFKAKVQKIGSQCGKDRLMIYITQATSKLGIVKGDIIEFTLEKVGNEPIAIKNGNFKKKIKKTDVLEEVKEVKEFTADELKFKEMYLDLTKNNKEQLADFYKKKALDQFGEARVDEILGQ